MHIPLLTRAIGGGCLLAISLVAVTPTARSQGHADEPVGLAAAFAHDGRGVEAAAEANPPEGPRVRLLQELNRLRQSPAGPANDFAPPLPPRKRTGAATAAGPAAAGTHTDPAVDRLVSPLLIFRFAGVHPNDPGVRQLRALIQSEAISGVLVGRENMVAKAQTKELLKFLEPASVKPRPFVAAKENGRTQPPQPAELGVGLPNQREVAAKGNPQYAYQTYETLGANLASLGFNFNFGPFLSAAGRENAADTFGVDPLQAAVFAKTFVMGHTRSAVFTAPIIAPEETNSLALKALLVAYPNNPVAVMAADGKIAGGLRATGVIRGALFCFLPERRGAEGDLAVSFFTQGCDALIVSTKGERPEAVRARIGLSVDEAVKTKSLSVDQLMAAGQRVQALRLAMQNGGQ